MTTKLSNESPLIFSYLSLRKAVGILGTALPFVLFLGGWIIFQTGIQPSISSYYHTGMRDVFVGTLCAIGVFLLSYKGYEHADNIAGNLTCLFAVGVALFPTAPTGAESGVAKTIGIIHLVFAALFFLTLIYFSLVLFTKTNPRKKPTPRKLQRNNVYKACGYIMAVCIFLSAVYYLLPGDLAAIIGKYNPIYWLEAAAIVTFGISWLTKGEAILKDEI